MPQFYSQKLATTAFESACQSLKTHLDLRRIGRDAYERDNKKYDTEQKNKDKAFMEEKSLFGDQFVRHCENYVAALAQALQSLEFESPRKNIQKPNIFLDQPDQFISQSEADSQQSTSGNMWLPIRDLSDVIKQAQVINENREVQDIIERYQGVTKSSSKGLLAEVQELVGAFQSCLNQKIQDYNNIEDSINKIILQLRNSQNTSGRQGYQPYTADSILLLEQVSKFLKGQALEEPMLLSAKMAKCIGKGIEECFTKKSLKQLENRHLGGMGGKIPKTQFRAFLFPTDAISLDKTLDPNVDGEWAVNAQDWLKQLNNIVNEVKSSKTTEKNQNEEVVKKFAELILSATTQVRKSFDSELSLNGPLGEKQIKNLPDIVREVIEAQEMLDQIGTPVQDLPAMGFPAYYIAGTDTRAGYSATVDKRNDVAALENQNLELDTDSDSHVNLSSLTKKTDYDVSSFLMRAKRSEAEAIENIRHTAGANMRHNLQLLNKYRTSLGAAGDRIDKRLKSETINNIRKVWKSVVQELTKKEGKSIEGSKPKQVLDSLEKINITTQSQWGSIEADMATHNAFLLLVIKTLQSINTDLQSLGLEEEGVTQYLNEAQNLSREIVQGILSRNTTFDACSLDNQTIHNLQQDPEKHNVDQEQELEEVVNNYFKSFTEIAIDNLSLDSKINIIKHISSSTVSSINANKLIDAAVDSCHHLLQWCADNQVTVSQDCIIDIEDIYSMQAFLSRDNELSLPEKSVLIHAMTAKIKCVTQNIDDKDLTAGIHKILSSCEQVFRKLNSETIFQAAATDCCNYIDAVKARISAKHKLGNVEEHELKFTTSMEVLHSQMNVFANQINRHLSADNKLPKWSMLQYYHHHDRISNDYLEQVENSLPQQERGALASYISFLKKFQGFSCDLREQHERPKRKATALQGSYNKCLREEQKLLRENVSCVNKWGSIFGQGKVAAKEQYPASFRASELSPERFTKPNSKVARF